MKFITSIARPLESIARKVNVVIEAAVSAALVSILGVLIMTVISRYFFRIAAPWIFEFVGYATAFIGAFGFSCLVHRRKLLAITFLKSKFSPTAIKIFNLVVWVLLILYFRIILEHGFAFASSAAGRFSHSMVFPLEYVRLIMPVGAVFIIFQSLNNIVQDLLELTSPSQEDPEDSEGEPDGQEA